MFHGFKNYLQKQIYQEQLKNLASYINQKLDVGETAEDEDLKSRKRFN